MAGQSGCGVLRSEETSQRGVEFTIADALTSSVEFISYQATLTQLLDSFKNPSN